MTWWLWLIGSILVWTAFSIGVALAAGRALRRLRIDDPAAVRDRGYA